MQGGRRGERRGGRRVRRCKKWRRGKTEGRGRGRIRKGRVISNDVLHCYHADMVLRHIIKQFLWEWRNVLWR